MTIPTMDEVKARIEDRKPDDFFGFEIGACGRFITRQKADHGVNFCDDKHLLIFMDRNGISNG